MDFKWQYFNSVWLTLLLLLLSEVQVASGRQLDIVLLLDSSDKVRSANFEKEKAFAMNLTGALYNPDVRIAVYTFGELAYSQFTLNMYADLSMMQQSIEYMWYSTGDGAVEPAINYTVIDAFQPSSGDRECVTNILIILSHESIMDVYMADNLRRMISQKQINTFVLNMANASAATMFATITNNVSRVWNIPNFDSLNLSVSDIVRAITTDPDVANTGCGVPTEWVNWSGCSRTCGASAKFRTRQCIKKKPTDKDCNAKFSEYTLCDMPTCTDPIDGDWAFWTQWGVCTKSCATGSQSRTRTCTQPSPSNGGRNCIGNTTESRPCAIFPCPDCSKLCPAGGQISKDCKICQCSNVVLLGQVMNDNNETVREANIFLESAKYSPLTKTDIFGKFEISHVCLMNEVVYIKADKCADKHIQPVAVNSSHWTLPAFRLERYVPPILTVQPSDKIRMVGQSLSLCCAAAGKPTPTSYIWYKDGIQLDHLGTNGTLYMSSLIMNDTGKYKCKTETEAGLTQSHEATVVVKNAVKDTCDSPSPLLQTLPPGCFVAGDSSKNNTIDVGSCGKLACMRSALYDNGSCADYWPYHCCEAKDVQTVDIECDGFRYKTSQIISCECKLCMFKSVVSGKAFGRQNGSDIPLQLGKIIMNGEVISRTSMAGFFKFELPKGTKRIVITFHDDKKKFNDVTKVIQVNDGSDTFATVVIPFKPKPIPFDSQNGTEINLGVNDDGLPPAAQISIQPDSIVTADGQPYTGEVKTSIHFMDPRNRDDIEAANGDFDSEAPDGRKVHLQTFGMYQLTLTDTSGKELSVNKPIKTSFDASLFDIPLDENGNPDVALWTYDANKGTWVEVAQFKKEPEEPGRRRLLASMDKFVTEFHPTGIPQVKATKETVSYEQRFAGYSLSPYNNYDRPIYDTVKVVKTDIVEGICYLSVSVYKDLTLVEAYDKTDVSIKTFVQHQTTLTYVGANTTPVNSKVNNGHVCIPVFCGHNVYIQAVRGTTERLFAGDHYLPNPDIVVQTKDNEVLFVANVFGGFETTSSIYKLNTLFEGPVFTLDEKDKCESTLNALDNHFTFKFAPFTKGTTTNYAVGSGKYDERLAWYPVSPSALTFRTCFMKINIKVIDGHDIRFIAKSHLDTVNGEEFGSYEVGPTPDPRTDNVTNRGACFEFRCPGLITDRADKFTNRSTAIEVRMVGGRSLKCTLSNMPPRLAITPITDAVRGDIGFTFIAEAGDNYGSKYGVFIADKPASGTEQFCNSGVDAGPIMDGVMTPSMNPAVTFDCT